MAGPISRVRRAIRDVFQNHLLQIVSLLAMDRPAADDGNAIDAAKVALLGAIRPLRAADVVRGQYDDYLSEDGVAPNSRVETYVAARLEIQNRRWAGVPFWIQTGKCLAITATEVRVRLKRPVSPIFDGGATAHANEFCFGLNPDVFIALTARAKVPGDALSGDRRLFGSQPGVEAAWRIVEPILKNSGPVFLYERGSGGPTEGGPVAAAGGWSEPIVARDRADVRP